MWLLRYEVICRPVATVATVVGGPAVHGDVVVDDPTIPRGVRRNGRGGLVRLLAERDDVVEAGTRRRSRGLDRHRIDGYYLTVRRHRGGKGRRRGRDLGEIRLVCAARDEAKDRQGEKGTMHDRSLRLLSIRTSG